VTCCAVYRYALCAGGELQGVAPFVAGVSGLAGLATTTLVPVMARYSARAGLGGVDLNKGRAGQAAGKVWVSLSVFFFFFLFYFFLRVHVG
jgi:hypothetical protein